MSSKSKQQNTVTYAQNPVTPQIQQLQGKVSSGEADPSIPYAYAQGRQDIQNSFNSPLGAYTTPAVRDASGRVANERMSMDEASAIAAGKYNAQQQAFGQQATVASLTQPVQTGGTSTTTTPFSWGGLLGAGIGAGAQLGTASIARKGPRH